MKIKELNVIEFGGLTDRRFELSDGLNIFEGNNETGKSTLWLFVKFMLYGMPKKGHPEREKSINRMTHRAAGTMTVNFGGEDYRIERSFSENSRGKVTTYRVSDGEKVFAGEEPGEAMLSVPRDIFENSVAIGQGACAGLGGDKGAAAIRNMLSSADESVDVEKIQKKLNALRVLYRHQNGKGGKLHEMLQSIDSLESRLGAAVDNRLKITDTEEKLTKNSENIQKTETALEEARTAVDRLGKREILRRFDTLAENKKKLVELNAKREELLGRESREGYFPLAVDGAALVSAADGYDRAAGALRSAERKCADLRENDLTDEERELAETGALIENDGGAEAVLSAASAAGKKKTAGIAMIVAGAVFLAASVWNFLAIVGVPVAVALIVVGIIFLSRGIKGGKDGALTKLTGVKDVRSFVTSCCEAYEKQRARENAVAAAEADKKGAAEYLAYFDKELGAAMRRVRSALPVNSANAVAEAAWVERTTAEYGELCGSIDNIRAYVERDEELLSVYDETAMRSELADVTVPDISATDAEENKRFYDERLRVLRVKENDLKTALINLKAGGEDPTALKDELAKQREEYEKAEEFYEAVLIAMDGIEKAAAAVQGNITPSIGRNAAELIRSMTDGRYKGVNMGRSLELTLIDEKGLTTTTDMMSGGMRDAAYIALRISLMKNIFGGELPPLMMDEALCQLDGERTKKTLRSLSRLCADGAQVLLFTCHSREGEICESEKIEAERFVMREFGSEK